MHDFSGGFKATLSLTAQFALLEHIRDNRISEILDLVSKDHITDIARGGNISLQTEGERVLLRVSHFIDCGHARLALFITFEWLVKLVSNCFRICKQTVIVAKIY
jgi:hypothetical protein